MNKRVQAALAAIGGFPANWVPEQAATDLDVVIVGGGQSGLSIAFSLMRLGISRIRIIEAEAKGGQGVWHERAYMPTLRTPLVNPGPELGVPELSLALWYDSVHGEGSFSQLQRCSTADWAAYLDWFRDVLGLPIEYDTRLVGITPEKGHLKLSLDTQGGVQEVAVRKVILATGLAGSGRQRVPAILADLPSDRVFHSLDKIDPQQFAGARIGVIGSSTSAFDMAAIALENNASSVSMLSRRAKLVEVAKFGAAGYPGAVFASLLSDEELWDLSVHYLDQGSPPPIASVQRVVKHDNFKVLFNASLDVVSFEGNAIRVTTGNTTYDFDYVLCATGFETDLRLRPEFKEIATHAETWGDRLEKARFSGNVLSHFPYLTASFALHPKQAGTASWLSNVHVFNYAAHINAGRSVGDISSLSKLVPRLVSSIGADLFLADRAHHLQRLRSNGLTEGLSPLYYQHRIKDGLNGL